MVKSLIPLRELTHEQVGAGAGAGLGAGAGTGLGLGALLFLILLFDFLSKRPLSSAKPSMKLEASNLLAPILAMGAMSRATTTRRKDWKIFFTAGVKDHITMW